MPSQFTLPLKLVTVHSGPLVLFLSCFLLVATLCGCAPSGPPNANGPSGEVVEIETIEVIPADGGKAPAGVDTATNVIDDDVSATKQAADKAKADADEAINEAAKTIEPLKNTDADATEKAGAESLPKVEGAAAPDAASSAAPQAAARVATVGDRAQERVALGEPALTAGVPGSGALTLEQIDEWLAHPKNSLVLEPVLPLGLSQGAGQIQGLERNPLTRAKIELGRQLYFDTRLSADSTVSCASCHNPTEGYSAHTKTGVGIRGQLGNRHSPVSFNRILSGAQFWDGRAESLEAQAVGPIANPIEMGFTHEGVVKRLQAIPVYKRQFDAIFGSLTIDGIAQAIAAFERVLVTAPSPYDFNEQLRSFAALDADDIAEDPELSARFAAAQASVAAQPLSADALRGREIFFTAKGNCTACHVGANLADERYHNIGIGMDKPAADLGRFTVTQDALDKGAFKTPTVRNVTLTAPYMHDGSIATLEEVVEWYDKGGHPNPNLSDKIRPLKLTPEEKSDLVAFMKACTGQTPSVAVDRLPTDN